MTTNQHVAQRVRDLREARGWSQADLARRLAGLGSHLDRSQVGKIELGPAPVGRNVTAGELVLLALAFGTAPTDLLFPIAGEVELTEHDSPWPVRVPAREAREWAMGRASLSATASITACGEVVKENR